MTVTAGGVLVIDEKRIGRGKKTRTETEIQVPNLQSVSLSNGGWIRSTGSFARQTDLDVDVSHGGTVDVRSMNADRVTASVEQGGRILTVPQQQLFATVQQGGVIIYWGDARVESSVQHGGDVQKGIAAEKTLPLHEAGQSLLPVKAPRRPHK